MISFAKNPIAMTTTNVLNTGPNITACAARTKLFLLTLFSLHFSLFTLSAQQLTPIDKTPIYRRSFTARYELIGGSPVREAALSPDKTRVGFVRDNNLYVKELSTGAITPITHDGATNKIINGATDWVYEEEYAFTRAWEFSPDSRQIAWLRFDESAVPEFSMMRYNGNLYPTLQTFKYPKAGEPNSTVTLHVCDIATGSTRQIDTGPETDQYIPRIGWIPQGGRSSDGGLFFYRVNRLQNQFEVVLAEGRNATGNVRTIYHESSPTYVERPDNKTVTFLPDGDRFIVRQETRTGWMHLYLHSIADGLVGPITSGEWEVADIKNIDGETITYSSTELSHLALTDYSVGLNGRGKRQLSQTILETPADDPREFLTIPISRDISLNAWIMLPKGFNPTRPEKYPLLITQYSGPGSQSVSLKPLSTNDMAIYKPLLDAGIIVACVDPRGTGLRGEAFKKCTHNDLGNIETRDHIAAAQWFSNLPYVDHTRIGIYGWSYGGFIALNAILKGANTFSLAVAVAPVTSWRFYDTIYTEIYNGLPSRNPAGYDLNSPINYAGLLRGDLLLIHGSADDNVHLQNTLEMARALTAANKNFDMLIYPDNNHSMAPTARSHVRQKIASYIISNL
jgi:dipeptidyl-peptidase-4